MNKKNKVFLLFKFKNLFIEWTTVELSQSFVIFTLNDFKK